MSTAATFVLVVHDTDTIYSHAHYLTLRVLVDGLCARHPTHSPHPAHCAFQGQHVMSRESACFSQITMHPFKYTSVSLYPNQISRLIFPQCSERISFAKTIHEMHIRICHISKSRHYCCCHRSCYRYYCPSPITALRLSLRQRNL
jgi:hypothetical protein